MSYRKVQFTNGTEATAGLVFEASALDKMTLRELSRYFPLRECWKMKRVRYSIDYPTMAEAIAHNFDSPTGINFIGRGILE